MLHLTALLVAFFTFAAGLRALAQDTVSLAFDVTYDNGDLSLDKVACSDGPNDLEGKGYTTLGSLPTFPNVGGVFTVKGWDSPECGACYAVTYNSNTVNILAVDRSTVGFTVSQAAMNSLTGGQATELGRVNVTYTQVDSSVCGLKN